MLQALASDEMEVLNATVTLRAGGQAERAFAVVLTDRGNRLKDGIREVIDEMQTSERGSPAVRKA